MDERIQTMAKESSEFLGEYTTNLLQAVGKFTERLLDNVTSLTVGVIDEGAKVVLAATEVFLPEEESK